jgi:protein tyrosine/serine phosphatase
MNVKKTSKALAAVLFFIFSLYAHPLSSEERDLKWAVRLRLDGVPNFHMVTWNIYRGAQPTLEGFKNLERMGVKTVVNLRTLHRDNLEGTSLREARVPMRAWEPEAEEIADALRVITDEDGPYFVHCQHGADRTGAVIAVYRMAVQGWEREEAIREMTDGDYGFHSIWMEIPKFLRRIDIEEIKSTIGI